MAYEPGAQDGSQGFGLTTGKSGSFIVESFSESKSSSRVDIDDGNGKPIGSSVVPERTEVSLTVQFGESDNELPKVGALLSYNGLNIGVTSVDVNEVQADYTRATINGFVLIGSLTTLTDIS